jgi:hypothetical protein
VSVSSFRWFLNPYGGAHGWWDFSSQGSFNLVKKNNIYICETFLYSLQKCIIIYMSIMFQYHEYTWRKGKWIWKILRSKAKVTHTDVGVIEVVEVIVVAAMLIITIIKQCLFHGLYYILSIDSFIIHTIIKLCLTWLTFYRLRYINHINTKELQIIRQQMSELHCNAIYTWYMDSRWYARDLHVTTVAPRLVSWNRRK